MHARIRLSMNLSFAVTVMALGAFAMPRAHAADLESLAKACRYSRTGRRSRPLEVLAAPVGLRHLAAAQVSQGY
jgi:hypothetical protein